MISVFTLIEQEHFVYLNLAKSRVSNAGKKKKRALAAKQTIGIWHAIALVWFRFGMQSNL